MQAPDGVCADFEALCFEIGGVLLGEGNQSKHLTAPLALVARCFVQHSDTVSNGMLLVIGEHFAEDGPHCVAAGVGVKDERCGVWGQVSHAKMGAPVTVDLRKAASHSLDHLNFLPSSVIRVKGKATRALAGIRVS